MSEVFSKVYVAFWTSGLGARLGDKLGYTLMALASYMNENYECWPTQEQLAERLGVSRAAVNERIKALADFRWNGHPILTVTKRSNGAYGNNVYRLSDWCQITIFKANPAPIKPDTTPVDKRTNSDSLERARAAKGKRKPKATSEPIPVERGDVLSLF